MNPFDLRCKLLPCQKERIRVLYPGMTKGELASMFKVHRRTIDSIINPGCIKPPKTSSKETNLARVRKHRQRIKSMQSYIIRSNHIES